MERWRSARSVQFILELGAGFAFIDRQKRIVIDGKDYRIDLLFYHRGLRRLLAIDLKIGAFEAADKGQMELYLRWLERNEMHAGEEPPLGLILCADKGEEQVELLQLGFMSPPTSLSFRRGPCCNRNCTMRFSPHGRDWNRFPMRGLMGWTKTTELSDRQHDRFDNPAKALCRDGNPPRPA